VNLDFAMQRLEGVEWYQIMNKYLCVFISALAGVQCFAAYPDKPIRIVTPFPAGSVTDIIARPLALRLTEAWSANVIVDNRGGAGGNIAGDIVAKAPPDGYTLLIGSTGPVVVNALLYAKMPYDTQRAFAPVTLAATAGLILVVHPSMPVKTVKDLVVLGKTRPGQLTYGSSGTGSTTHLAGALFTSMTGVQMIHVAYKGGSPQYTIDLITGRLELAFASIAPAIPHVRSGRLKMLGTSADKRDPQFPDMPTIAESGVPGYDMRSWYGVLATAGTPQSVIEKLNAELVRILALPDLRAQYLVGGLHATSGSAADFAAYIKSEHEKWVKVVKSAGIRAE
jgi:tripartite-type tricarboxylate transporter receptor subunit TctC